ncbi:MAG: methylmalonyl-CoA mutase family protein [Planctomycetes bacterium]|nr:methylmalonyl-CoA mutase family protein [Planctomycetota bacterium]
MERPLRFVTAAALYDGHDASINIVRRVLLDQGVEVIHLGHNRSAEEIVDTAIQEDADAIAVSSYQGGHNEFFRYMRDLLAEKGAPWIHVFGGGGGVIVPAEIEALERYGVTRIYSPEEGRKLGLVGMIRDMISTVTARNSRNGRAPSLPARITEAEANGAPGVLRGGSPAAAAGTAPPVIGITGTGGAGKSSLTDEILRRLLADFPARRFAVVSVDPTKRRTGGALLGDRIRMNAAHNPRVFMRSLATRASGNELPATIRRSLDVLAQDGFDLILLETSGIGQGDSQITELADLSVYVMTGDYGAATQLEKIDMIDFADLIVLNKYDKRGGEDALREVRKQYRRSRGLFSPAIPDGDLPVYGSVASHFNDSGVEAFYRGLLAALDKKRPGWGLSQAAAVGETHEVVVRHPIIPPLRATYLLEIASAVREYKKNAVAYVELVREAEALERSAAICEAEASAESAAAALRALAKARWEKLPRPVRALIDGWPALAARYAGDEFVYKVRELEIREPLHTTSLAGTRVPRIALPRFGAKADLLGWLLLENVPGEFPYTGGSFPFRRRGEDPKRMFAGEGPPERTNARFHYLCRGEEAKRLSTAFDSVTLYGQDPDERPDIFGKVGESGVSICCLDDMKKLYAGFDLVDPMTSVSMTINGPAPMILAMFFNTAIDQAIARFERERGHAPSAAERSEIQKRTLQTVRGTVQADILKEDQAQNTCIFSTEFALRMMGDIQQYFIEEGVRNYYSVSISGYHIAEAGANPITQLAFTLANGFTYVEYYLSRGMKIDDFAPNLSFFFSNGLDAEYSVIGRVARRVWAIAIRDLYGGQARSQKLKYHVQTSGRSLHAMEIDFNDIRTTLQALMAYYDNCNSLHTNAYDEAITTPTEGSVRRAMAIQLIIARELGTSANDNPLQGAFIAEELTELVEEAVLAEFLRLNDRGGAIGAMERQYQRGKIQDESLLYEHRKHTGELPIVGINTFLREGGAIERAPDLELRRATVEEKRQRIADLRAFQKAHEAEAPEALRRLRRSAASGGNVFRELMHSVRHISLGQITQALFEVGGQYRRNM